MTRVAVFGAMGVAVVVAVIVLASSSGQRQAEAACNDAVEDCEKHVEHVDRVVTCDAKIVGDCLPRIGYLDTKDTMWTGQLVENKVVMINFWATWCAPCKKEVPDLTETYAQYKDQGLVLLGVLMDSDDVTDEKLAKFASDYNLDYPVVRIDQQIWADFGQPGALPTTYIYDRHGNRRFQRSGAVSKHELDSVVTELLAEPPPTE